MKCKHCGRDIYIPYPGQKPSWYLHTEEGVSTCPGSTFAEPEQIEAQRDLKDLRAWEAADEKLDGDTAASLVRIVIRLAEKAGIE